MKKLERVNPELMALNPFTATLQVKVKLLQKEPDDKPVYLEADNYVKLFNDFPKFKKLIYDLKPGAKSLLWYIILSLEPGCDWVQVNVDWYMKQNGIKARFTYREAAKDLCRACIINASTDYKDVFWVNPAYFYCGSRPNKYPDNKVIMGKMWIKDID